MDMEKLVSLCKRRGFIFPSSEIYGGINGFWDYGPLGVELKRNVKETWWRDCVQSRDDMVGLDCAIVMNPRVWEASGHVGGFNDPMVDCRETKGRYRADQLYVFGVTAEPREPVDSAAFDPLATDVRLDAPADFWVSGLGASIDDAWEFVRPKAAKLLKVKPKNLQPPPLDAVALYTSLHPEERAKVVAPESETPGTLTEPRQFNLMFATHAGAVANDASKVYLRPETAQGIFVNFKNVCDTARVKLPFGIAQIGKSFRNEITPRNFTFRSREFEQMEIEFFCKPSDADQWYQYWRDERFGWYVRHGLQSERLRLRDHDPDELAFYSTNTADVEYEFPFGISELEGIAHRGDYDLRQHQEHSKKDLTYFDDETKERFLPHVIEPSAGADRATLAFLCEAYVEDEVEGESRSLLRFHPRLAPIKAAVFPLVKKEGMPEKAHAIHDRLRQRYNTVYDEKGAVGRRYRRQDEAGTPFCITVDGQTLEDDTVTLRDRDSLKQWRVPVAGIEQAIDDLITGRSAPPE